MRITVAFALLNIAVTGVFTLVFKKEEDRVNSFVRKTGKIEERNKRAVLSQAEEMMVREEIFLESLASKLARRKNAISVGGSSELVPRLKSFLKTFRERPRLQTKGRNLFEHYLQPQSGALSRCAFSDFHTHPLIAFEHLSLHYKII